MEKYRSIVMGLIMLLLAATGGTAAYEEVEDLVDIYTTDNNFIAVVDSRRVFNETIRARETIQWQGAQGEVGAFLTNERLLAVSIRSGQWNTKYLKIKEKKQRPQMLLGAQLVVMLTDDRIVGFGILFFVFAAFASLVVVQRNPVYSDLWAAAAAGEGGGRHASAVGSSACPRERPGTWPESTGQLATRVGKEQETRYNCP